MNSFFIFCANYLFIFAFLLALLAFFRLPRKARIQVAILGVLCAALSYGIALIAGQLYNDPRPFVEGHFRPLIAHDTENGFPSDHVLMLSVIAAVFSFFNKRSAFVLWLIAVLVGFARVYAGVHHYIDIIASMLIVTSVVIITYGAIRGRILNWLTSATESCLTRFGLT
jgi:undecaprenyl-diphosphatase